MRCCIPCALPRSRCQKSSGGQRGPGVCVLWRERRPARVGEGEAGRVWGQGGSATCGSRGKKLGEAEPQATARAEPGPDCWGTLKLESPQEAWPWHRGAGGTGWAAVWPWTASIFTGACCVALILCLSPSCPLGLATASGLCLLGLLLRSWSVRVFCFLFCSCFFNNGNCAGR